MKPRRRSASALIVAVFVCLWCRLDPAGLLRRRLGDRTTASCRAAALGSAPKTSDLEALGRPLPAYMLRATGGVERRALQRWAKTLRWRCEIGDEAVLAQPHPKLGIIQEHYPTFVHLPDRDGHATYWELLGKLNETALRRAGVRPEDIVQHYIWSTLYMWDFIHRGDDIGVVTVIADLEGASLSFFTPTVMRLLKTVSRVLRTHFPNRESGIYMINAPVWCDKLFKIAQRVVSKSQIDKVHILTAGSATQTALRELVNHANLPSEYGGGGGPLGSAPLEIQKRMLASGVQSRPALTFETFRSQVGFFSQSLRERVADGVPELVRVPQVGAR